MIEGSLEAKLPTIWTHGKAQPGRSSAMEKVRQQKIRDGGDQRWRKLEEKKVRDGESQKREDAGARKVGKSPNTVFLQRFVAPEGRRVGSLKQRLQSQLAR